MKKLFLLTCSLCLMFFAQAQTTVTTTAGNLRADLIAVVGSESNLGTITQLKINGTLNAQDFVDLGSGTSGSRINKAALTSVDLSGVTAVENNKMPYQAFYQYTGLQNITFPTGGVITTIGEQAFNDCTSLLAVDIPEGVTTIEDHAFSGDNKVTTLRLPATLRTIGVGAFNQFNALEQLTLPAGLTYIGGHAFFSLNNPKMTQITIPASVEYIGAQAFALALYNESVTFAPRDGRAIEISGDRVFRSSGILSETGMSVFEFPDNTIISFNATGDGILSGFFSSCDKLKEVRNLPAGLTEFRFSTPLFGTFSGTAIEELTIPETVTIIGQAAFSSATKLKSIVLPNSVTTIGNSAFANTTALTSVNLGNSVQSIGTSAFNNAAALEILELPATVTVIGESAFRNMTGLKALIVNNPDPVIFSTQINVFTGINKETCTLYVPESAVQDYKDYDLWNTFVSIKPIGSSQTISGLGNLEKDLGTGDFELTATASSGLAVSYTIADPTIATIHGSTVQLLKVGTTTITASQAGNDDWLPAQSVVITLNVTKGAQAITGLSNIEKVFGANDFELTGTVNSGLDVHYNVADPAVATITDGMLHILKAGTTTITATQPGNDIWAAAPDVVITLVVHKADQVITGFDHLAKNILDGDFALTAVASSGLEVSYTIADGSIATVTGNAVHMVAEGSTTITAIQAGNEGYNGVSLTRNLVVNSKQTQSISGLSNISKTYGDADFDLTATASSGLAVTYEIADPAIATITGNRVHLLKAGITTITAVQVGDDHYNSSSLTVSLNVIKGSQTITFAVPEKVYGDVDFDLTATSSSGLPVTYTIADATIATITGATVHIVKPGTTTITATQGGDERFNSATQLRNLTVSKANQTITFSIPEKALDSDPFSLSATSSSGLALTYTTTSDEITLAGNEVTIEKGGRATITASQPGNDYYNAATLDASFCIQPLQPGIELANLNVESPLLESSASNNNVWYRNGEIIAGAIGKTLNAASEGAYTVRVVIDGCASVLSEDFHLIITGINDEAHTVKIYPNPADDFISIKGLNETQTFQVVDMTGGLHPIQSEKTADGIRLDVQHLRHGLYLLHIKYRGAARLVKFVKK